MKQMYQLLLSASIAFLIQGYSSQLATQQDRYLNENFFKNKKNGVFIDIGAHDGMTHSNTYFFEKVLGWTGICIEPMPKIFEKLKVNRNSICINCCVSKIEGTVPFLLVEGPPSMLSGIVTAYDPRHLARIKLEVARDGGSYKEINLPSRNINNILAEHQLTKIDYVSLDTEGNELEILQSIDFSKFYIFAISVENNFAEPNKYRKFLESKGFRFVALLGGQDEIYINTR